MSVGTVNHIVRYTDRSSCRPPSPGPPDVPGRLSPIDWAWSTGP